MVTQLTQLNKWQQELERLSEKNYEELNSELFKFYKSALIEIKKQIKSYIDNYDMLSFSRRLEAERLLAVAEAIDEILSQTTNDVQEAILEFIEKEAKNGYYGVWYALEGAANLQLNFPILDNEYINELVFKQIDGMTFSERLYERRDELAKKITDELQMAYLRGDGYQKVAKRVNEHTEATYKQALRIARTEGGRAQSSAKQRVYEQAKKIGVKLEKQWLSTFDKKTRHDHRELDGQIVPVNGHFKIHGYKAKGPRLFGIAKEDINCRCTTIAIVNGITPELRKDNETKEIVKYKKYKEWAKSKGVEV